MKYILSILLLCIPCIALGQVPQNEVFESFELNSAQPIERAYGTLIFESAPGQTSSEGSDGRLHRGVTRKASITQLEPGRYQIRVELSPKDYHPNSQLGVVGVTKEGVSIASEIRWLVSSDPETIVSVECRNDDPYYIRKILALEKGILEQLLENRRKKLAISERKISEALTVPLLRYLNSEEKAAGLNYPEPISETTPPSELAFRVSALMALRGH